MSRHHKIIRSTNAVSTKRVVALAVTLALGSAMTVTAPGRASASPLRANDAQAKAAHVSSKEPQPPQITLVQTYTQGVFVYFRIYYRDPGHDAIGFGFGGSGWAEENHPFTSPSYGIVAPGRVDYPFNLGCGTAQQYDSSVNAWIYDTAGDRSNVAAISLSCTAPPAPVTPKPSALPDLLTSPELPECVISMVALSLGLAEASGAALATWTRSVHLLEATGSLATFLSELRTNNYWQALLDAAIVQPLRACFDGVQILLDDTAGQAGTTVGKWMRKNLHP